MNNRRKFENPNTIQENYTYKIILNYGNVENTDLPVTIFVGNDNISHVQQTLTNMVKIRKIVQNKTDNHRRMVAYDGGMKRV